MKYLLSLLLLISTVFSQYTFNTIEEAEYDGVLSAYRDIITMNDSIFVIAYFGGASDMILQSYEVDSDFTNITQLDSITTKTDGGGGVAMVKYDDAEILIAYSSGESEYVETFSMNANWEFTQIDSISPVAYGGVGELIMPKQNYFFYVTGNGSGGYRLTYTIDGAGDNITLVNSRNLGDVIGVGLNTLNDTSVVYSYINSAYDLAINTDTVDVNFNNIGNRDYDVLAGTYGETSNALIDATHLVVHYSENNSPNNNNFWRTCSWDSDLRNITQIDYLSEASVGKSLGEEEMFKYGNDYILFQWWDGTATVRSYNVDGSYQITDNVDAYEFTTNSIEDINYGGLEADAFNDSTFVVAYTDSASFDGWLAIVQANTPSIGWSHSFNGVASPTAINGVTDWTKINGVE